jgi:hypothetical protein
MAETPVSDRHRREAERFQRLSGLAQGPSLRQTLSRIAELHRRIAEQLEALESSEERRMPSRTLRVGHADRTGRYELRILDGRQPMFSHEIRADSDIAALQIAFAVQDACSDLYQEFELWQGPRRIARTSDARGVKRRRQLPEFTAAMQEVILEAMQALLHSSGAARSAEAAERLESRRPAKR